METRALKAEGAAGAVFLDLSAPGQKHRPLKRFRRYIENSDWDEKLLQRLNRVDSCTCALAAAASLYIIILSLFILY